MDHATALRHSEQRAAGRQSNQDRLEASSRNRAGGPQNSSSGCSAQNVGNGERIASALAGAALVIDGISRGGLGGLLLGIGGGALLKRGATGQCQLYQAMGIDTSCQHNEATSIPAKQGIKVEKAFTINRSAEDLFDHWSKLENLPKIMRHLKSVQQIEGNRTRWIAEGPMNMSVQWEAEIVVKSRPDVISWRSLPGSQVDTAGSVHFKPLGKDRGTMLKVSLKYDPPGGKVGAAIAWLFGKGVEQQLDEDLRRFKSLMEAGEAPTIQGQSRGQ